MVPIFPKNKHDAQTELDQHFMRIALHDAQSAAAQGEVPVGALVVKDGKIIGSGKNNRETQLIIHGHAEMTALQAAAEVCQSWRLEGCTLYVTLEPCLMCAGAIQQARIERLVFGAKDPKAGAICSKWQVYDEPNVNHRVQWTSGILADDCAKLLKDFFKTLRKQNKAMEATLGGRGNRKRYAKQAKPIKSNTPFVDE